MKNFKALWKKYSYLILLIFLTIGIFDFRIGIIAMACMLGPIILSIFKGRYWCGNICPRGSFYDNVVSNFSAKKNPPKFLKSKYFRAIITLGLLSMFTSGIIKHWGDLYAIGFIFYRLIVVTTLVGIILSFFFNHRTWCNFCPMGSIAAFISYFKNKKNKAHLLQIGRSCVSCKLCEKKCSMGIVPYDYKEDALTSADCIQCGQCVTACPKKVISYK